MWVCHDIIPKGICMSKAVKLAEGVQADAETSATVIWRQHRKQKGKQQQEKQEPCCTGYAAGHSLLQMRQCAAANWVVYVVNS